MCGHNSRGSRGRAGPLTAGAAEEVGASGAFFTFPPLVFFIPGSGGDEGATGEAGGDRSERSDKGADPSRAPEEDDVELLNIFSEQERF